MSLKAEAIGLFRSSAFRLAMALSVLFVLILLAAGGLANLLLVDALQEQADDDLKMRFETIAERIRSEDDHDDLDEEFEFMADPRHSDDLIYFAGFRSREGRMTGLSVPEAFKRLGTRTLSLQSGGKKDDHDKWRVLAGNVSGGVLVVGRRWDTSEDILELLPGAFLAAGGAAVLLTLGVGVGFGVAAQRRIRRISRTLDQIAEGDLGARVGPLGRADDLRDLAAHVDGTTARLEILLRQTRELSVNIAHDLKTPLTRLRARLEALAEASVSGDEAPPDAERALEEIDRIISTFDAILQIARMDAGAHNKRFEDVDLGGLASDLGDAYGAVIEDSGFRFALDVCETPSVVRADPALLKQALANLIENALRYGSPGGEIRIGVSGRSIWVMDEGPAIPDADKARVLEPFVRLDAARSSGGFGLGLALVQSVAQLHKARVILTDTRTEAPRGLTVRIDFA